MKQLKYTLSALLVLFLFSSCVEELDYTQIGRNGLPANSLILSPSVLDNTLATKSPGVADLGENDIESLDVYVYRIVSGTGESASTEFFKRYHFLKYFPRNVNERARVEALGIKEASNLGALYTADTPNAPDILLESNWQNDQVGYKVKDENKRTVYYRIYVIANSELPDEERCADFTEADLKQLWSTSPITHSGSYDIVRPKNGSGPDGYSDIHIKKKTFLMYGKVDNWHIDEGASQQYFTDQSNKSFLLKRAAAKFSLTLKFGNDFVTSLTKEPITNNDGSITREVTTIGNPQFKFTNFMPSTYNLMPEGNTLSSDEITAFRNAHLWTSLYRYDFPSKSQKPSVTIDNQTVSFPGVYDYFLTTYSYAFDWTSDEIAETAPSVMVRVDYVTRTQTLNEQGEVTNTGGAGTTKTVYYRIPLVDVSQVTKVERNFHYQMEATINAMGSSTIPINPTKDVTLTYKVVPWPDNPDEKTQVDAEEMYYFVADCNYVLRGNTPVNKKLDFYTTKAPIGTYKPVISNIKVYYKPDPNSEKVLTENHGISADGPLEQRVEIEVKQTAEGAGHVSVTSDYLKNRAVKYITFTASVTFNINGVEKVVSHDYMIKHFPLDNIQSVTGWWSSRWYGSYEGGTPTGESYEGFSAPEGWISYTVSSGSEIEVDYDTYLSLSGEKRDNAATVSLDGSTKRILFGTNNDETIYNNGYTSLEEALGYTDGYYYWVTREWEWIIWPVGGYYVYTYHRANKFWATQNIYTQTIGGIPSTGKWFDWGRDHDQSYNQSTAKYTYDGTNFQAKVYYSTNVYPINVSNSYYYSRHNQFQNHQAFIETTNSLGGTNTKVDGLTNNHMYIIQISKAEDDVPLGRPRINSNNYMSQDNVVSPAFMIASQLGAVSTFYGHTNPGQDAAKHCHTYMEVATNGVRFVGWRLPTKKEVAYIVRYQKDKTNVSGQGVFQDVLTGNYYYTLDGTFADTEETQYADGNYAVRCVRDLTLEEIEELNNTGNITESN